MPQKGRRGFGNRPVHRRVFDNGLQQPFAVNLCVIQGAQFKSLIVDVQQHIIQITNDTAPYHGLQGHVAAVLQAVRERPGGRCDLSAKNRVLAYQIIGVMERTLCRLDPRPGFLERITGQ
ncbi:hypothetical protein D3C84_641380 [compost metagenome]